MLDKMYGYKVGDVVETVVRLQTEGGVDVSIGSRLRLVAFAPKVRISRKKDHSGFIDGREYFYNAVRESQESDYGNRIRANFCTIRKIKA